jgi:prepilin-type N-terminal cleavage/methylation domain-containing protein
MNLQHAKHFRQRGFTLLEVAMAVLAMAIVLGVSMVARNPDASKSSASEAAFMDSIVSSLFKYVLRNNRLPCPDLSSNPTTGLETVSSPGVCAASNKVGKVPYLTLEVPLSSPVGTGLDQQFTYGVYRGGGVAAKDLTLNEERSLPIPHVAPNASYKNLDDFKQGAMNASSAGLTSSEIYVTGNDSDSGASDCSANQVDNMAFIVAFQGGRNAAVNSGMCFVGPGKPFSPTYDNLVRAVGFSELIGVLSR